MRFGNRIVKYVHVHPQNVPAATTHEGTWCTVSLSFKSSCNRDLRISSGLKVNTHQDGSGSALSHLGLACLEGGQQIRAQGISIARPHVAFPNRLNRIENGFHQAGNCSSTNFLLCSWSVQLVFCLMPHASSAGSVQEPHPKPWAPKRLAPPR